MDHALHNTFIVFFHKHFLNYDFYDYQNFILWKPSCLGAYHRYFPWNSYKWNKWVKRLWILSHIIMLLWKYHAFPWVNCVTWFSNGPEKKFLGVCKITHGKMLTGESRQRVQGDSFDLLCKFEVFQNKKLRGKQTPQHSRWESLTGRAHAHVRV